MTDQPDFKCLCGNENSAVDVVFIHGLTGDASSTWIAEGGTDFWPTWLFEDVPGLALYSLGFPSSLFAKWAKKEMDMFERAGNVLELFAGHGLGKKPIIFVTHSLGGILIKMILRKACDAEDEDWKCIAEEARLVVFLSTPHTGASLASALEILPGTSKQIKLLANETGFLEDLNLHYRKFANGSDHLSTAIYYEKHATKKVKVVVSRDSADPGVAGAIPVSVDKDHINICKPPNRDDIVFRGIRRHVRKVVDACPAGQVFGIESYTEPSDSDRRDLLQKLIDAGREHEYDHANNAQNRFARRYVKTGLLTAAREDHDSFLSEIEARFVTHAFHPLICSYAPDNEVRAALQDHVIQPLTNKQIGGSKFDATSVLNALYYLTEQCHIRWDAPES